MIEFVGEGGRERDGEGEASRFFTDPLAATAPRTCGVLMELGPGRGGGRERERERQEVMSPLP